MPMTPNNLSEITERTRAENAARSPQEWIDIARKNLDGIRSTLQEAKRKADIDVPPDNPVAPASATITGAFIHIGVIEHALEWIERNLSQSTAENTQGEHNGRK